MDILPRSSLPSYIEGNPGAKNPQNTPLINPTVHDESNGQSNDAAKFGLLGKILVLPRVPLLTSTGNGGLGEFCGPNASLMNGNWLISQVGPQKHFHSCKPQQANGNHNSASTSSRWPPCNHRPRNGRSFQTNLSRFLLNR